VTCHAQDFKDVFAEANSELMRHAEATQTPSGVVDRRGVENRRWGGGEWGLRVLEVVLKCIDRDTINYYSFCIKYYDVATNKWKIIAVYTQSFLAAGDF
jgi:hypothetical protein